MKHLFLLPLLMMVFPLCHASINTQGYKCYQTFDEYKMCGVGTPVDTPFVYVRETPDRIIVKLSTNPDESMVYVREGTVWEMDTMLDAEKMSPDYRFGQSELWPRRYTRYCGDGCIIELFQKYNPKKGDVEKRIIYVKNDTSCIQINVPDSFPIHDYNDISRIVDSYQTLDNIVNEMIRNEKYDKYFDSGYILLKRKVSNDTLRYFVDSPKFEISYEYKLNSLKEFGMQPGLFEKSIYPYFHAFRKKHIDDGICRTPDKNPEYPGGDEAIKQIVLSALTQKNLLNDIFRYRMMFYLLVNEKGKVLQVKRNKPSNHVNMETEELVEKETIKCLENLPKKFSPGKKWNAPVLSYYIIVLEMGKGTTLVF